MTRLLDFLELKRGEERVFFFFFFFLSFRMKESESLYSSSDGENMNGRPF